MECAVEAVEYYDVYDSGDCCVCDGDDDGGGGAGAGFDGEAYMEMHARLMTAETEVQALRQQVASQRELLELMQSAAVLTTDLSPVRVRQTMPDLPAAQEHHVRRSDLPDTPLLLAVERNDVDMVRILVDDGGADVRAYGDAALLLACQGGLLEVARYLLTRGADVHVDRDSPLLWAARKGDEAMVKLLLEHGADAHALKDCPLRLAVSHGHTGVARLLVGHSRA